MIITIKILPLVFGYLAMEFIGYIFFAVFVEWISLELLGKRDFKREWKYGSNEFK